MQKDIRLNSWNMWLCSAQNLLCCRRYSAQNLLCCRRYSAQNLLCCRRYSARNLLLFRLLFNSTMFKTYLTIILPLVMCLLNSTPDINGRAQFQVLKNRELGWEFWGWGTRQQGATRYCTVGGERSAGAQQKWLIYWNGVWWDGRNMLHGWGDVCGQDFVGTQRKETTWKT